VQIRVDDDTRDAAHLSPAPGGMALSRRAWLAGGVSLGALALLGGCGGQGQGNTLVVAIESEPTGLTTAITSLGSVQQVSSKIFDGLLSYASDLTPVPRLATAWQTAEDGLSITLHLRQGVRWHDGKPFTATDVAWTLLNVWKIYHSRGRSTFANVVAVDTPDAATAVLRLSRPAPYILAALASNESQVLPAHVYAGKDVLTNPANAAPIGNGPFKFVEWQRGQFLRLERNPDYWDKGKPHLDGLVFRFMTDSAAQAAALEAGEVHLATGVAINDVARVAAHPGLYHDTHTYALAIASSGLEFNLDLPQFKDVRVRRAIAHALDGQFIAEHILFGLGQIATGPIPHSMPAWYTPDVPRYPYDPARAEALLDEAGARRDAHGHRFAFTLDPAPSGTYSRRLAEYIRAQLGRLGIEVTLRSEDFATFVKRVYTDRDFEVILDGGQMGPDPAIGTQRWYWSKSFRKGVAFSNASHYANPQVDHLLESAQTERDPAQRRALYNAFQKLVQSDLPRIPLIELPTIIVASRRLSALPATAEGIYGNFADLTLSPT
jgi:peptide/nickel transport system substrate-binding protein